MTLRSIRTTTSCRSGRISAGVFCRHDRNRLDFFDCRRNRRDEHHARFRSPNVLARSESEKRPGARRHDILVQFLVESATLALVGGLIGICLGSSIASVDCMFHAASCVHQVVGRGLGFNGFDDRRTLLWNLSGHQGCESRSHRGVAL